MAHVPRSAIVLCILVSASGALAHPDYGFTISASSTDPFDNTPLPTAGLVHLYLMYVCNNDIGSATGLRAFESGFDFSGADVVFSATRNPAFVVANVWGDVDDFGLEMSGCKQAPGWLMQWAVFDGAGDGVSVCFRRSDPSLVGSSNQIAAIDCDPVPDTHAIQYFGFDSTGGVPCDGTCDGDTNLCDHCPVSVEGGSVDDGSWGSVKGLYR